VSTTPLAIITRALRKSGVVGVGQTPAPEDTSDALADLNDILSQWQRKRWLVYHLVDVSKVSTGAQSYTVGPGQDFDVARPDRIESAFLRQTVQSQPNQVDYPLEIIQSREDYNQIRLKTLTSFPSSIFYDSAYPVGTVYPWPLPLANIYAIHLTLKEQLGQFTSLTQTVNLPPEYGAALLWNLCRWLRRSYQLPPDAEVNSLAQDSLNLIRNANAQIPTLGMPKTLIRDGVYNFWSDTTD
jgi:hypothetical protein